MNYKNALVTGGAGFIGSYIAKKLCEKGINVTIIDNLSTGSIDNVPEKTKFIKGTILDIDQMKTILKNQDIDIIFHEAACVSVRNSFNELSSDAENNILGTVNLLSACVDSGVKKFVYASSMAVYADSVTPAPIAEDYSPEPISPYGISKLAGEKYCMLACKEIGIPCTSLRYFNTYGIGQRFTPYVGVITIFINKLIKGEIIEIFGTGEQRRDFIHVKDIVEANMLAMEAETGHEIINVGTGKATSVKEIAELLISKINPSSKPAYVDARQGEISNSIADISKANTLLNFFPKRYLDENIDDIIQSLIPKQH